MRWNHIQIVKMTSNWKRNKKTNCIPRALHFDSKIRKNSSQKAKNSHTKFEMFEKWVQNNKQISLIGWKQKKSFGFFINQYYALPCSYTYIFWKICPNKHFVWFCIILSLYFCVCQTKRKNNFFLKLLFTQKLSWDIF